MFRSKSNAQKARLWRLLALIAWRNRSALIMAGGLIYVATYANAPSAIAQSFEMYLIVFFLGMSLFLHSTEDFFLGFASALASIILTDVMNLLPLSFERHVDNQVLMYINVVTVSLGFLFSTFVFKIGRPVTGFALWAILVHFLLLGIFQRDQFGTDFFPYTFNNPIQWMPAAIFVGVLGLMRLTGLKHAGPHEYPGIEKTPA
jgi:hypothetical protein